MKYAIKPVEIIQVVDNKQLTKPDLVVIEEPLEIRLGFGKEDNRQQKSISVTMRTPTGHDFELALGFLYTENIIQSFEQILSIYYCTDANRHTQENIVRIELKPEIQLDVQRIEKHFYTTSSCGICGKASIEMIQMQCPVLPKTSIKISSYLIQQLPALIREKQLFFEHTGGLHAAAITKPLPNNEGWGEILLREDIGRHNALDKAIGALLLQNLLPLTDTVLFMSSRASFELIQKAVMAGISILICVGAPSSLAIETAQEFGLTLIGFLRGNSFNIYHDNQQIIC